ncbi:ABC transporter substrate-binding protein [Halobellus marinus]|uniref:ABC transporter substrate-binding protein n=1 Tax=Halobellus TaxID=1073986 RepID=UPI0028A8D49F|nr:extracellular solute-binding protein [Halobellus sp. DFY28]
MSRDDIGTVNRRKFLGTSMAVGIGALAGCSGGTETATLQFMTDQSAPESQDVFESAFDEWAETRDEDVESEFQYLGFEEVWQQAGQQLEAGSPPDLLLMRVGETSQFGLAGHLSDLSGVIDAIDIDIPDRMLVEFDGDSVYLAHDVDQPSQFYRTDIYDDAGVEPGSTWEEDLETLSTLDENLDEMDPMLVLANDASGPTQWFHDTHFWGNGVHYVERDGGDLNVTIDQEPYRERAIETLEYLQQKYQYSPASFDYSWGELIDTFATEQVATTHYVGRLVSSVAESAPEVYNNMAAAPDPVAPLAEAGDADYVMRGTSNGFSVPAEADNADLAKDFLEYFMNNWYTDSLLAVPIHKVPVNLNILDSDAFQEHELVQENQEYVEYVKEWNDSVVWIQNRTEPATPFLNGLTNGSGAIPTMISSTLLGEAEPGEAVDAAADELRDLIENEFSDQVDQL